MSETIKLGDTVRFQATVTHPISGFLTAADSNVRYYAFVNDSETASLQGDMIARSGVTGLYRGCFIVSPTYFASGQYVSIKASGMVNGYSGWGNIKDFIVSDISLANIIQWSGVNSHPDDVGKKVWNYGNAFDRTVDIFSIAMKANGATALGAYWDCVATHSCPAAGGTSNTITLHSTDTYAIDSIASGCKIKISAGIGEGQYRTITGFVASPYKVATISEPWIIIPQSGLSSYIIYDGDSNQRYNPSDLYYANIKYTRKNVTGSWQDNFSTQWYKNGSVVTSGQLTDPRLSIYNTIDGNILLNNVSMNYSSPILGSTYYSSSNPSVMNSGIPYMVAISGTIDGQTRQWNQIVGLDLL